MEHPNAFPLSQLSVATRIESPHIPEHIDGKPTSPVQVYPVSKAVQVAQPGRLPLSHF